MLAASARKAPAESLPADEDALTDPEAAALDAPDFVEVDAAEEADFPLAPDEAAPPVDALAVDELVATCEAIRGQACAGRFPGAVRTPRMSVDLYVTQLDEAGMRGVQGSVLVAGRMLGCDQVTVFPVESLWMGALVAGYRDRAEELTYT